MPLTSMVIPKSRATYSKIVIEGRTGGAAELATRKGAAAQRRMPRRCDDKGRTGGATMKGAVAPMKGAAAVRRQRQNWRRNDEGSGGANEGSGGATTKAEPAARQHCANEGSGGATTKAEPAAQ